MKSEDDITYGYADYIIEMKREQRGLSADDSSQDAEIVADLQSGEKLSKSKHMK